MDQRRRVAPTSTPLEANVMVQLAGLAHIQKVPGSNHVRNSSSYSQAPVLPAHHLHLRHNSVLCTSFPITTQLCSVYIIPNYDTTLFCVHPSQLRHNSVLCTSFPIMTQLCSVYILPNYDTTLFCVYPSQFIT
jgi:hypothetical protein